MFCQRTLCFLKHPSPAAWSTPGDKLVGWFGCLRRILGHCAAALHTITLPVQDISCACSWARDDCPWQGSLELAQSCQPPSSTSGSQLLPHSEVFLCVTMAIGQAAWRGTGQPAVGVQGGAAPAKCEPRALQAKVCCISITRWCLSHGVSLRSLSPFSAEDFLVASNAASLNR